MKKLITLLLCLCLIVGIVGCGQKTEPATQPSDGASPAETATQPTEGGTEPEAPGRYPELIIAHSSEPSNLDCTAETNDAGAMIMCGSI